MFPDLFNFSKKFFGEGFFVFSLTGIFSDNKDYLFGSIYFKKLKVKLQNDL